MATVTALVDYVCDFSGMTKTAAAAERTLVLAMMNQAYTEAVAQAECYNVTTTASLTTADGDYEIGTSPFNLTGFVSFNNLWVNDSASTNEPLVQVTENDIREARRGAGSANSTPTMYAVSYPNIYFYPLPAASTTLSISYARTPLTLVESGASAGTSETTPTAFPAHFHYSVLANHTLALAYNYMQRSDQALIHKAMGDAALVGLAEWKTRVGGIDLPMRDGGARYRPQPDVDTGY